VEGRIDMQGTHAGVEEQRRVATGARSRRLSATLLVAAFVGFLLPFATVSCGTPVTFTGIELATANVPSEGIDDTEFAGEVESNGTTVAAFALGLVVLALALLLARIPGWGLAALGGLLAVLLLPWIAASAMADFELHEGYVLSAGALAGVQGVRRVDAVRRRRSLGRRVWPAVLTGVMLAIPLVATVLLAASSGA
jgi:hypothetical protein